jgi:hypothetical protein
MHECYSSTGEQYQHHHRRHRHVDTSNNDSQSQSYSSSYCYPNTNMSQYTTENYNRRHLYYPVDSSSKQAHYSYHLATNPSYESCRSNYVPLSDFVSTKTSAFKPIVPKRKDYHACSTHQPIYEQLQTLSDDPCDLEVAQYFPQTSQWSNPNYFDIYTNDRILAKMNYTETLC